MKVSYYPGCSLDGTAVDYNESLIAVSKILGVELEELPDWSCCGSSSAHALNDKLSVSLAGRNLIIADKIGQDLLVPCASCFQRLKFAEKAMKAGEKVEGMTYKFTGNFEIKHAGDFFWDQFGEKPLTAKIKKSLEGLNPVCYYGCLTTRPQKITDAKNPEDPQSVDEIMKALGANVKNWSYKTDCCGGNIMLTHPDLAKKLVKKLLDNAIEAGADCIVVSCPLCHSNLDTHQHEIMRADENPYNIPIYYFTEMMGLAFGDPSAEKCVQKHFTDGKSLLKQKGLL
jgi:heterodisulfide reductase subunit B2